MEHWILQCKKADFAGISERFNISPLLARIIRNRDIISDEDIYKYLHPDIKDMYDPFLLKGMEEGTDMVLRAIEEGEKIRIIGDYDVDGVCSSYILKTFIEQAGGRADVCLPDRMLEGYGMNENMVTRAALDGVRLIITCDNGISANAAAAAAREAGIGVIVTDHHEPPEVLPDADVIIDAKQPGCPYPFKEICGGAVAFKFAQALNTKLKTDNSECLDMLMQFAGMATIADIVPLTDENRIFAHEGLKRLRKTGNAGINALLNIKGIAGDSLSAWHVGFILGPCINSAGRLKNAAIAFDLLSADNSETALRLAQELSDLNDIRKSLTAGQTNAALEELRGKSENNTLEKIIVQYLPKAHESVAGIIAGRIKDEFNRPAIVVTSGTEGLKGSGRSTDTYNMIEALREHEGLFEKYGGHAKACGFSLVQGTTPEDAVRHFSEVLNSSCSISDEELVKYIRADMQLPFRYVTEDFINELNILEPFGMNNEKPVFANKNIRIVSAYILGKNNNVMKMQLADSDGTLIEGVMFGDEKAVAGQYESIINASEAAVLFYPEINEFRGTKTVQIRIISLKITA
ncbi:MAG: single-stranded-DNA-specific exonuclease RecJ [Parasporobacterium sp.]|nr:single-stranded-DNA-specific exonuclease RecJ [Parasporobacterium sp.]